MKQREIRYRALYSTAGGMKWAYGLPSFIGEDFVQITQVDDASGASVYNCIPGTLGQFIGLKDRNGKEVWEGDVVERPGQERRDGQYVDVVKRGLVVFGPWSNGVMEDNSTYLGPAIKEGSWYGHLTTGRDLTVIGNIHEHPELLKP